MAVGAFSVTDQTNRIIFFKQTFLLVNVSSDVIFGILFLILSGADIDFQKREL